VRAAKGSNKESEKLVPNWNRVRINLQAEKFKIKSQR